MAGEETWEEKLLSPSKGLCQRCGRNPATRRIVGLPEGVAIDVCEACFSKRRGGA